MTTTIRPSASMSQEDLPIDQVIHGDALTVLRTLPDHCVDAVCVDPPAGISFMNKEFDHNKGGRMQWVAWLTEIMAETLRVIKPGGHAFVWALPRTSHWPALAIEDAGWEIREKMYHLFSTGFPKALNVSKAIDAHLDMEREIVGIRPSYRPNSGALKPKDGFQDRSSGLTTVPASPQAQQWEGWFSATKPAAEEWILARAPLSEKSIAENVLKWGVGALNIDASRVKYANGKDAQPKDYSKSKGIGTLQETCKEQGARPYADGFSYTKNNFVAQTPANGRYPSNVVFSHSLFCTEQECSEDCAVLALERQSGVSKSGEIKPHHKAHGIASVSLSGGKDGSLNNRMGHSHNDQGTAARFYHCFRPDVPFIYTAKASSSERNKGIPKKIAGGLFEEYEGEGMEEGRGGIKNASGRGFSESDPYKEIVQANTHPTIKSQSLMRHLLTLITPPGGLVLDFFAGSGSTGVAAISLGMHCILIEQSDTPQEPYVSIARSRLQHALHQRSLSLIKTT